MYFDDERQKNYINISDACFDEDKLFDQFCVLSKEIATKKKRSIKGNKKSFLNFCELYKGLVCELAHNNAIVTASIDAKSGTGIVNVSGNEIVFNDSVQLIKLMTLAGCCEIEKTIDNGIHLYLTVWGLYERV